MKLAFADLSLINQVLGEIFFVKEKLGKYELESVMTTAQLDEKEC